MRTFDKKDDRTGEVETEYRGRKATVLTSQGFVEVNVPIEHDALVLEDGLRLMAYVELSEWLLDNGRRGASVTYRGPVTAEDFTAYAKVARDLYAVPVQN